MGGVVINNIDELRAEIARVRQLKDDQGKAIAKRFNSPLTALSTIYSAFPHKPEGEDSKNDIFHQDLFGILSRVLLPFLLNNTLFRNSNFITKGLIGLLSQKASHFINEESVNGVVDKVKSMFSKKKRDVDYGIPPESEAS